MRLAAEAAGKSGGAGDALVAQSARTTLLNVAGLVTTFFVAVTLTRVLGRSGYGAYVYAVAWATPIAVVAQRGYPQLVARSVASYAARQDWDLALGIIRRSQRVVIPSSAILVLAAAAVGGRFLATEEPIVRRAFLTGLLLVPVLALRAQREAVIRGMHRAALGRIGETIIEPTLLLGFVTVAWLMSGVPSTETALLLTVAAVGGGVVAATVFASMAMPPEMSSAVPRADRSAWSRSARWLLLVSGLQVVNQQMGVLMLGTLDSVASAAVFAVAVRWSSLVPFLQNAVIYPLSPSVARFHANGDLRSLQRLISRASFGVFTLSLPVAAALLVFGQWALAIFGGEFRVGTTTLSILIVGELLNVASGFVAIIMINTGQERAMAVVAVCSTAVKAALSVVCIQRFGLEGAAAAQAIGVGLQNVALAILVWRRLGLYSPAIGARRWCKGP